MALSDNHFIISQGFVDQKFGQGFCSTWCQLESLSGFQVLAGLGWRIQYGFTGPRGFKMTSVTCLDLAEMAVSLVSAGTLTFPVGSQDVSRGFLQQGSQTSDKDTLVSKSPRSC